MDFDDVQFVKDGVWPLGPVCAMKNYKSRDQHGFPEHGFITIYDKATIIGGSIHDLRGLSEDEGAQLFARMPKTKFESVEAMVAAGWIVD